MPVSYYRNSDEIAPERGPRPSSNRLKSQVRRSGIAFKPTILWEMVEASGSQVEVKITGVLVCPTIGYVGWVLGALTCRACQFSLCKYFTMANLSNQREVTEHRVLKRYTTGFCETL